MSDSCLWWGRRAHVRVLIIFADASSLAVTMPQKQVPDDTGRDTQAYTRPSSKVPDKNHVKVNAASTAVHL